MIEGLKSGLWGALIGLAKTCDQNQKTEQTTELILVAFRVLREGDAEAIKDMTKQIRKEKYTISPGCLSCTMPCGNTDDFDFSEYEKQNKESVSYKKELMACLEQIRCVSKEDESKLYRGLCYLSYDLEPEYVVKVLNEIKAVMG